MPSLEQDIARLLEKEDEAPARMPTTMSGDLAVVMTRIQRELEVLQEEHRALLERIRVVRQAAVSLVECFGPEVMNKELGGLLRARPARLRLRGRGITEACRKLLSEHQEAFTVDQALEEISARQPEVILHYKQPKAALRTVLTRLVDYGEAKIVDGRHGMRAWIRAYLD